MAAWTRDVLDFEITAAEIVLHNRYFIPVSARDQSRLEEDARTKYTEAIICTILLNMQKSSSTRESLAVHAYNAKRDRQHLPPIDHVRMVHFDQKRYQSSRNAAKEQGVSKRAHDRRGHWRHLSRSGVDVWVSSSRIHGGSLNPPRYVVAA